MNRGSNKDDEPGMVLLVGVINFIGKCMEITIKIAPNKLGNPNADLRYTIADEASRISSNMIEDDGYDYDDKDNMLVFLSSKLPHDESQSVIMQVLSSLGVDPEAIKLEFRQV